MRSGSGYALFCRSSETTPCTCTDADQSEAGEAGHVHRNRKVLCWMCLSNGAFTSHQSVRLLNPSYDKLDTSALLLGSVY